MSAGRALLHSQARGLEPAVPVLVAAEATGVEEVMGVSTVAMPAKAGRCTDMNSNLTRSEVEAQQAEAEAE